MIYLEDRFKHGDLLHEKNRWTNKFVILTRQVVTLIFGLLGPVPRDILSIALVSKAVGKMLRGAAVHLDLTTSSAAPPSCADALSRQQHALRSVQQTLPGG